MENPMSAIESRLKEIKERCEAALPNWRGVSWTDGDKGTHAIVADEPGPPDADCSIVILESPHETDKPSPDLVLACHARTDLPALVQALELAVGALKDCIKAPAYGAEKAKQTLQQIEQLLK